MDTLGRPWETRGETRSPQDGLQMPPQRLIEDTPVFGDTFWCPFWTILGAFLDSLGTAWEARGRTRTPQDGLQMPPQRLILDTLVAKRWPGQPEQVFG